MYPRIPPSRPGMTVKVVIVIARQVGGEAADLVGQAHEFVGQAGRGRPSDSGGMGRTSTLEPSGRWVLGGRMTAPLWTVPM